MSFDELLLTADVDDAAEAAMAAARATVDAPHATGDARLQAARLIDLGLDELKKRLRAARSDQRKSPPAAEAPDPLTTLERTLHRKNGRNTDWSLIRFPAGADREMRTVESALRDAAKSGSTGIQRVVVPDLAAMRKSDYPIAGPAIFVSHAVGTTPEIRRLTGGIDPALVPREISGRALSDLLADPHTDRAGSIEKGLDWWRGRSKPDKRIFYDLAVLIDDIAGIPNDIIDPSYSLVNDLDFDDLAMRELLGEVESKFDVEIPEADITGLRLLTVGDLVYYVQALQRSASPAKADADLGQPDEGSSAV